MRRARVAFLNNVSGDRFVNTVLSAPETSVVVPSETSGTKKRRELSVCNVVFCLLVLFIHISAEPVTLYDKQSVLYIATLSLWRLSSFVVQGFLFLSGVKLFLPTTRRFSYRKFYLSRLKRVVLPYIAAFVLFYLFFLATGAVEANPLDAARRLALGDLTAHFYFVVVIVQFYLLMPLWRAMAKRGSPLLSVVTSLLLMAILKQYLPEILRVLFGVADFPHNSRLFTSYLFFFILGVFCGEHYERFWKALREQKKAVIVGWILTAFVNCVFIYWNSVGVYYAQWLDNFHILYCFLSILLSLLAAERISVLERRRGRLATLITRIDEASYTVYLVHPLFIFLFDRVARRVGIESVSLRYLLRFIVVYALSCGLCFLFRKRR